MKLAGKWPALILLLTAGAAAVWLLQQPHHENRDDLTISGPQAVRKRTTTPDLAAERLSADAAAARRIEADWQELLRWLDSDPRPDPDQVRARLLETRIAWAEMDPQILAEALERLLKSGDDLTTGLEFKVGLHGFLAGWPTLRVFLLDVLATSDPEMAARIGNGILDDTESANEYATALRSLTRPGRGRADDAELMARFNGLLDRPDWQRERGFAEAMDLVRYLGSAEAAARLAAWDGNPALKTMALHEFAAENPDKIIGQLESAEGIDGVARANLMARANPADPAQLAAVDTYLRRPDRSPEEAKVFLDSFPLRSATTGFRLYGKSPAPYTRDQISTGDRAALELVNQWARDSILENHRPHILALQHRLEQWTREPAGD